MSTTRLLVGSGLLVLLCAQLLLVRAQVSIHGKYRNSIFTKHFDAPLLILPAMDNGANRLKYQYERSAWLNHTVSKGLSATATRISPEDASFLQPNDVFLSAKEPLKSTHFKFGIKIPVDIDMKKDGHWADLPNGSGKVWKLHIHSPNSFSLNLLFDRFKLLPGAELYIKGEYSQIGAFTAEINNKPHGYFATAPLEGRHLELEYYKPATVTEEADFHINYIVHGFRPHGELIHADSMAIAKKEDQMLLDKLLARSEKNSLKPNAAAAADFNADVDVDVEMEALDVLDSWQTDLLKFGGHADQLQKERYDAGECHINAPNCREAAPWINQIRATVLIMTAEGTGYCTGCMINNAKKDGRQLLLTANHCIHDASINDYRYNIVIFNYHSSSCAPIDGEKGSSTLVSSASKRSSDGKRQRGGIAKLLQHTAHGLKLLASSPITDYALLEVEEVIPENYEAYLAGWSTSKVPPPYSVCVHHALGGFKKISILNDTLKSICWGQSCSESSEPDLAKIHDAPGWEVVSKLELSSHWYLPRWSRGATEIGSSGAPLFSSKGLCIGQLQGGESDCRNLDGHDIFGALGRSMKHGLSEYLNPSSILAADRLAGGYLKDIRENAKRAATTTKMADPTVTATVACTLPLSDLLLASKDANKL